MKAAKPKNAPPETTPTPTSPHTNMSPDLVAWWSSWSDGLGITAVVIGGFLAIITAIGWGFSWKAGKLKDDAFETYKTKANLRISYAKRKAANANKIAAKANELAATLEKEAAKSNERASKLELESALARRDLEQLRQGLAPRLINSEQRKTIAEALYDAHLGIKLTMFSLAGSDADTRQFAENLYSVIGSAGDSGISSTFSLNGQRDRKIPKGLVMVTKDKLTPDTAYILQDAIARGGFLVSREYNPDFADDAVEIIVGTKE